MTSASAAEASPRQKVKVRVLAGDTWAQSCDVRRRRSSGQGPTVIHPDVEKGHAGVWRIKGSKVKPRKVQRERSGVGAEMKECGRGLAWEEARGGFQVLLGNSDE